mmetsp:Transcript_2330/g.3864  ORF Transcript_2330/g.3864 Transcript_2330/m.3864 type:complete len:304 (+) Transcript_2330:76-987(+)|eukprot:CAMPEP_0119104810 /NCGR_PEP_ID=MMETSP1180-20130426/2928_1 /TAXON_ID=3052 ORGANISM="Chlamydomonas cf sp, Strain CCMP681" /NCGR_SAMPLE_ID=MMETSP1180 /ASSEMBLY_ACC=CAM_ASM_000741 /LENGTH=303 /DNA_ID=CAMNT_0007089659 /DNA_START=73 /DNA_END=984 /DNA_ORIENTATION=+
MHIPVFGIDVPELRLVELIPDLIHVFIKLCSRALDSALHVAVPLTHAQQLQLVTVYRDGIPREYDRVIQRTLEGKVTKDDQLSSELEDASYDYYRRMLRTGVDGASDEPDETFMARQLGFPLGTTATQQAAEHYADAHPGLESVEALVQMSQLDDMQHSAVLRQQEAQLQQLRARSKSSRQQACSTALNSGLGVGLGLLLFRGTAFTLSHILKSIRKARKARGPTRSQPSRLSRSTSQTPAPATDRRKPAAAKGSPAAPAVQQQAPSPTQQQPPQTQQQQPQEGKQDQTAPPRRPARPAARTR